MTSESDKFSQRKGAVVGKTILPSFAYSFIKINRLIQCSSLHSDNLNTHLHFELPFSLPSLAPQTTHSIANSSCLPPASPWLPNAARAKPRLKPSYVWGAHPQIQTAQRKLPSAFLSPHSCGPAMLFLLCLHPGRFSSSSSSSHAGPPLLSAPV